jgi:tRNA pseudouridine55 synthase
MPENGFLLVNKPTTWTSHDVVGYLRKVTHIKKIGHAGTLDPFASGLLLVAIGREHTKRLDEFKGLDKTYIATLRLGAVSDTFDSTGVITNASDKDILRTEVEEILKNFVGEQSQVPPMYSAKKVNGKKLYKLARKGIEVERKPTLITIYELKILDYTYPLLRLKIHCSTGTYIRTLAHDIGEKLGVGAYCEQLERTNIGSFSGDNALPIKDFSRDNWKNLLF